MFELRTPRRAVAAMFMLNGALFGIWASRIPAFVDRFELSPDLLGVLLLCLAAGAILSFPLSGRLTDRVGAADLTRVIAILYGLSLAEVALAPTLPVLMLCLFLFGAAHGSMDVSMNAWATEVERHLARPVMSWFHAMFSLGAGIGAASGYVAIRLGIGVLPHFACMAVVLVLVALWMTAKQWESEKSKPSARIFALPTGPLVAVGLVAAAASLGEGAMADWSAVYLETAAGAVRAQAALGYAVFSIAMVVTRLSGGWIVQRFGPVRAARLSGVAALLGVLVAVSGPVLAPGQAFGVWLVLLGFGMMGVGYAVIMPLAFSRAAAEKGIGGGQAIASVATLGYGGMLLGPPVIGFLAGLTSLPVAFLLLALLALLIILFAGAMKRG
ncbi:MFS transporter [Puniceibacterium sp. IMCC21224]|uniref:MFS transporter n=1 Tax=Puniceibacterium sp. IMCC21224 TaxID=1618204 RepID=UPI00064D9312|nr:MFS transporter [Puniceibacterium sp. IMCC21224]